MKTAEKKANGVQGATEKNNSLKTEYRPNITGKEAKQDETAKNQTVTEPPKVEEAKATEATAGNTASVVDQPANIENQPEQKEVNAEQQPKAEIRYVMPPQNIELRVKEVETLHRRSIQRSNLITRKKQLEAFEVALTQEADELNDNPYQGCKLIIKDDKNREFVTTTPGLIRLVTQFIYDACDTKLAEIEASIVFPIPQ